ncbi:C-reactive protein-like [Mantella aurantiaca]
MNGKVFLFPKPTATAHVILKPDIKKTWEKLSICLKSYTELTRAHSLFSVAECSKEHNTFVIFSEPPNACSVYVKEEENKIKIDSEMLQWKHTCVTWDSTTGVVQLWVNGKLYPRRVSKKGVTIGPEISIVLGQEQDSFGGGFQLSQSFSGEISDVHMWDDVLTPEDIRKVMSGDHEGNLINCNSLTYEIRGNVLVEPKLQCMSCY